MSELNPYTLSAEAKARWSERLNAALKQAGSSQKAVATELNPNDPTEKTSEVNRFVNADPKILKRWFTQRPEWVRAFADEMKWAPTELTALLEALLTAREVGETLWHTRFPELGAVGVEIPAPMAGERGESPDELIKSVVGTQAVKHPAGVRLILSGPEGRPRTIATEQLRRALETALSTPEAPVNVTVRTLGPHQTLPEPTRSAPPQVLVITPAMRKGAGHLTSTGLLTMLPWGPAQVTEMAVALAKRPELSRAAQSALEAFGAQVTKHPTMVEAEIQPEVAIGLLAEVASEGCPKSVVAARDLLATTAWRRALTRSDDALSALGVAGLERLMAALATRARHDPNDTATWLQAPREVVLDTLRDTIASQLGPNRGRSLAALVEEAEAKKGAAQKQAFVQLRQAILADSAQRLLTALVEAGVFTERQACWGAVLTVTQPEQAVIWAARGLKGLPSAAPCWLLDPAWMSLVSELARRGLTEAQLKRATRPVATPEAPMEATLLDVCAWIVCWASATSATPSRDTLVPAWATVVWAMAHRVYDPVDGRSDAEPWGKGMTSRLEQLSHSHRALLPVFDEDPVEELSKLVPPDTRALIARWSPLHEVARYARPHKDNGRDEPWFYRTSPRVRLQMSILRLCPAQVIPTRIWSFQWLKGQRLAEAMIRLSERADEGDERATALLSGEAWLSCPDKEPTTEQRMAFELLKMSAPPVLLSRVLKANLAGEKAACMLRLITNQMSVAERATNAASLVKLAEAAGLGEICADLQHSLLGSPETRGPLPHDLALSLAAHFKQVELLYAVADLPVALFQEARVTLDGQGVTLMVNGLPCGRLNVATTRWVNTNEIIGAEVALPDWFWSLHEEAHQAALHLHRLGDPDPLRLRWREGIGEHLEWPLWRDLKNIEGIYRLLALGLIGLLGNTGLAGPSVEALVSALRGCGQPGVLVMELPRTVHGEVRRHVLPARPLSIRTLHDVMHLGPMVLKQEVVEMADGLLAVFRKMPSTLPPALQTALDDMPLMHQSAWRNLRHERLGGIRGQALCALLDEDDAEAQRLILEPPPGAPPGADAEAQEAWARHNEGWKTLIGWLRASEKNLERTWELVRGAQRRSPEESPHLRSITLTLLEIGCEAGQGRPLPFVREYMMQTKDMEIWTRLYLKCHGQIAFAEVITHRLSRPELDPRTRAALTLDLVKLKPETGGLDEVLKRWALDDADPYLGEPAFEWRLGQAIGGAMSLLEALAELQPVWLPEALTRLWALALQLRIGPHFLEGLADCLEDDAPPAPMALPTDPHTTPPLLERLMQLLEKHGLSPLIVQAFDDPPSLPAPESRTDGFPPVGRQELLRGWLRGRWLRLAPASSLRATLADNPQELSYNELQRHVEVLQRLIDLGEPDLEGHALALAQEVNPTFGPLLRVKPGEIGALIRRWVQADPKKLRERSTIGLQIVSESCGDLSATLLLRALQPPEPSASS